MFRLAAALLWIAAAMGSTPLHAQTGERPRPESLITLGSTAEDRLRLGQLLGTADSDGFLLRSTSSLTSPLAEDSSRTVRWGVVAPAMRLTWNSEIPFSLNDGAMWAGRGLNAQLLGGIRADYGRLSLIFAPELLYSQNLDFQTIDYPFEDRDRFASPWHTLPESLDMPMRFGDDPLFHLGWGQSSLSLDAGPVVAGITTENLWWGPGVRNGIVMSSHGPGIPHLFVRSAHPIATPAGEIEGRYLLGWLTESPHFDFQRSNDRRSINALALTLRPAWEPNLTLGAARAVYAPLREWPDLSLRLLHVFMDVGQPNDRPISDRDRPKRPDQIFSLFGRWVFPEDGMEVYAEWARLEQPSSFRDFLVAPHHTQGYTLGLMWAKPVAPSSLIRLHSEVTYLEQSSTFQQRRVTTYYKSRPVPQGYTQRGQVVGASIGPGSSSQWVAADYVTDGWRIGLFGGRIRWENDAYYDTRPEPTIFGHDVSLFGGVRGGVRIMGADVDLEFTTGTRYNYLYQNDSCCLGDAEGVDVANRTLRLQITPGGGG